MPPHFKARVCMLAQGCGPVSLQAAPKRRAPSTSSHQLTTTIRGPHKIHPPLAECELQLAATTRACKFLCVACRESPASRKRQQKADGSRKAAQSRQLATNTSQSADQHRHHRQLMSQTHSPSTGQPPPSLNFIVSLPCSQSLPIVALSLPHGCRDSSCRYRRHELGQLRRQPIGAFAPKPEWKASLGRNL